ncbi:hypothetical protein FACS1894217_11900 [Clostridia bacterium]|nr:hypothetical protein FACS1894217_11900 [Clostridia bacterium]
MTIEERLTALEERIGRLEGETQDGNICGVYVLRRKLYSDKERFVPIGLELAAVGKRED